VEGAQQLAVPVIAVSRQGRPLGVLALGDELRADTVEAVAAMRDANLTPVLVIGENEAAARRIASQLGIEEVLGGVLPEGKAEIVRQLQKEGKVAMGG
jgi:P-type E1-E2 ATPase